MWNSRIRKILFSKTVHENQILPHVTHHRCSSSHNSGKNVRKCNVVVATNCPLVGISGIHHDDEEEEEVCNLRYRRQLVRRDKNLWRIRSLVMMSAVTFSLSYFFHYFFLEVVITIKSVALFVLSFRLFFWLVQLFCRRNIQRSERKGSFLKNGMILGAGSSQDSGIILTIKKGYLMTSWIVRALCAKWNFVRTSWNAKCYFLSELSLIIIIGWPCHCC